MLYFPFLQKFWSVVGIPWFGNHLRESIIFLMIQHDCFGVLIAYKSLFFYVEGMYPFNQRVSCLVLIAHRSLQIAAPFHKWNSMRFKPPDFGMHSVSQATGALLDFSCPPVQRKVRHKLVTRKKTFPNNFLFAIYCMLLPKAFLATIKKLLYVVVINTDTKSFYNNKIYCCQKWLNATKNIVVLHSYSCGL